MSTNTRSSPSIAKLTLASSLAGATVTSFYESTIGRAKAIRELEAKAGRSKDGRVSDEVLRYRHRTPQLAAAAALNSGLVAFCFFNAREHITSPILESLRISRGDESKDEEAWTWSTMRKRNVPETAVTAAFLGGGLNAWRAGLSAMPSGAITAALACTALQLASNEARVQRIKFVASRQHVDIPPLQSSTDTLASTPQLSSHRSNEAANTGIRLAPHMTTMDSITPGESLHSEAPSYLNRALSLIGITRVDDTEYLRRLKAKREIHRGRIRELETQIEEEGRKGL